MSALCAGDPVVLCANAVECLHCVQEILWFFVQMLLSLQHVHSKQILHRDLKTQNILLDKKKKAVKVGDFGISKVLLSKSKAYTVILYMSGHAETVFSNHSYSCL